MVRLAVALLHGDSCSVGTLSCGCRHNSWCSLILLLLLY